MDPKEKAFSTLLAVSALLSANSNLRTFNLEMRAILRSFWEKGKVYN